MAGKVNKPREASFEERLEQLEALAGKMEQGGLPLQELMAAYEEGMKLSAGLKGEIEGAKARMMEIKLGDGASESLRPSDVTEQDAGFLAPGFADEEGL